MIMMAIRMWMWMIIIPLCIKLCVVVVVDGVLYSATLKAKTTATTTKQQAYNRIHKKEKNNQRKGPFFFVPRIYTFRSRKKNERIEKETKIKTHKI